MKNLKKKNNKGFSLVELIVVVMIMAILAVALAPQVMKWVGNSRRSADVTAYNSLYSGIELALADETVLAAVTATGAADITVTMANGADIAFNPTFNADATVDNSAEALHNELLTILGATYRTVRSKVSSGTNTYTIIIDSATGTVSKGVTPVTNMD